MKILLLGRNGQLGRELLRSLAPLGELVAPARGEPGGDLADLAALAAGVRALRPGLIVNAAAYTAVDQAEREPELAHAINALAPELLSREAERGGGWFVNYSTDYVFDGSGQRPWREADPTGPLNAYGRGKLAGDRLVQAACARHLILRTSWVYAAVGRNFPATILRLARERERLEVVDDQFGAPTDAGWLADATAQALRACLGRPELAGLYHLAAAGETSWHGVADYVVAQARLAPAAAPLRVAEVARIASAAFAAAAERPKNSRLDSTRALAAFGLVQPHWQAPLAVAVRRMLAAAPAA